MIGNLPERGTDAQGSGAYGASRGSRIHKGIDLACSPGTEIFSPCNGRVTKIGKPYSDDPDTPDINEYEAYDYVQITDYNDRDFRIFYVEPSVNVNDMVSQKTIIGKSQKLRYEGITQHIHCEVKEDGKHIDPSPYI